MTRFILRSMMSSGGTLLDTVMSFPKLWKFLTCFVTIVCCRKTVWFEMMIIPLTLAVNPHNA
jgi:hypothetical protein